MLTTGTLYLYHRWYDIGYLGGTRGSNNAYIDDIDLRSFNLKYYLAKKIYRSHVSPYLVHSLTHTLLKASKDLISGYDKNVCIFTNIYLMLDFAVLRKATGNPDKLFSVVVLVYPSVSFTLLFHFK